MRRASKLLLPSLLGLVVACEGTPKAPAAPADPPQSPLVQCFATTYSAANVDEAIAACEQKHFGTEWRTKPPSTLPLREDGGAVAVRTHLDPKLIQAAVRARFDQMRACYDRAAAKNPSLRGKVTVKFVIDTDGKVQSAVDAQSELPDPQVVACVIDEYKHVRYPKPVGEGVVTVVYPIVFAQGQ